MFLDPRKEVLGSFFYCLNCVAIWVYLPQPELTSAQIGYGPVKVWNISRAKDHLPDGSYVRFCSNQPIYPLMINLYMNRLVSTFDTLVANGFSTPMWCLI